jgi:hypothetical protein
MLSDPVYMVHSVRIRAAAYSCGRQFFHGSSLLAKYIINTFQKGMLSA